jgi:hypothetical protein
MPSEAPIGPRLNFQMFEDFLFDFCLNFRNPNQNKFCSKNPIYKPRHACMPSEAPIGPRLNFQKRRIHYTLEFLI